MVVLKVRYNDVVKRFNVVQSTLTYEVLGEILDQLFALPPSYLIRYTDDEGDLISLSSDEELSHALEDLPASKNGAILRLHLSETSVLAHAVPSVELFADVDGNTTRLSFKAAGINIPSDAFALMTVNGKFAGRVEVAHGGLAIVDLAPGNHVYNVTILTHAGDVVCEESLVFGVEAPAVKPTATLSTPEVHSNKVVVKLTVENNLNGSALVLLDDVPRTLINGANGTNALVFESLSEGLHKIDVVLHDDAGNALEPTPSYFRTVSPHIHWTQMPCNGPDPNTILVGFHVTHFSHFLGYAGVYLDGRLVAKVEHTATLVLTEMAEGAHELRVMLHGTEGQVLNNTASVNFGVVHAKPAPPAPPPSVDIATPSAGPDDTVKLSFTAQNFSIPEDGWMAVFLNQKPLANVHVPQGTVFIKDLARDFHQLDVALITNEGEAVSHDEAQFYVV